MGFSEGDASGWDECLPSVAECRVVTEAEDVTIPDHGDLWRVEWKVLDRSEDSVTMRANCFSLPLQLTRSALLGKTDDGVRLTLLYSLTNLGGYPVPWSWCAHPLFAVEAGDRILLPESVKSLRLEGSGGGRLGINGNVTGWPIAKVKSGETNTCKDGGRETDLSLVLGQESGVGDKLFAGPVTEGWCALERPGAGVRMTVRFDPDLTPYAGLWICYGGWPEGGARRQVCVALEPATTMVDSLAETGEWSRILEVGETVSWPMELEISRVGDG